MHSLESEISQKPKTPNKNRSKLYCFIGIGIFVLLLLFSMIREVPWDHISDPEIHHRAEVMGILATVLKSYRSIHHTDARSFHDLISINVNTMNYWSDDKKSLLIWPDWSSPYCGNRPEPLQLSATTDFTASPYEFNTHPDSEFIMQEKSIIPEWKGYQLVIKRDTLEFAFVPVASSNKK